MSTTKNSKTTSAGLEALPQIEETMTNMEFVKACRNVVKSLYGKALRAQSKHKADPKNQKLQNKYLERAREYYLISKLIHEFVHAKEAEAHGEPCLIIPLGERDPKDLN